MANDGAGVGDGGGGDRMMVRAGIGGEMEEGLGGNGGSGTSVPLASDRPYGSAGAMERERGPAGGSRPDDGMTACWDSEDDEGTCCAPPVCAKLCAQAAM